MSVTVLPLASSTVTTGWVKATALTDGAARLGAEDQLWWPPPAVMVTRAVELAEVSPPPVAFSV